MKIKLKKGIVLPNNWKSCGHSKEDWVELNAGKSIEVKSVPKLIEDNVDVTEVTLKKKPKEKKEGGSK